MLLSSQIVLILMQLSEAAVPYTDPIFRGLSLKKYDQADTLQVEDKGDVLEGSKTVYAPEPPYYSSSNLSYKLFSKETYCSSLKEKTIFKRTVTDFGPKEDLVENWSEIEKYCDFDDDVDHIIYENVTEKQLFEISNTDQQQVLNENIEYRDLLNMSFNVHDEHSNYEIRKLQGKIMKKFMNTRVDPCVDFYEYACGNWRRYNVIPADRATYDTFEIVRENLDMALKGLLEDNVQNNINFDITYLKKSLLSSDFSPNDTSDATLKAKMFYISCMQEDVIAKRGVAPLLKILDELGGWPILNNSWNSKHFNIVLLLAKLRLLNNDILMAQWVGPDMKNSKEYIVHIDQPMLGLPAREYFLEESNLKYLKAYRVFILTVASLMNAKPNVTEKNVDDMIDFEIKVSQIMASTEDRRNISELYLRTDIAALTLYFPQFDWKNYFDIVLGTDIDLMTPVACYCAKFLQDLFYLISNTEPRTLQNYVVWRFVRHRTSNLDERFSKAKQRFYHVLFGREKSPPRWQFCVAQVNSDMGMALGSLFVKRYFDKQSKMDTTEITKALSEAFKATLLENDWLDNNTKEYARMKLDHMDLKIGYPDFILNATELSQRYYDVEIHPDYFFENVLTILRHLTKVEQKRMGAVVNRTSWSTPPAVVNAYYSRNKNQIMFPAGVLQPPFYNRHFPKALNFGGIGVIIGHEVSHGFDDKGRLFDQDGNLHMWWRESSIEKFYEKSACLIEQYGQYVLPDVRLALDGYLTQGENIADNGGLKQAFGAYETWLKAHPKADETLPGLNLSGKQLFFLNFAQVWCGQQRIEAAKSRIKTSVHSPGIFRVIGVLSNSEEFSKEYRCPRNSPMNPEVKCVIW
ncbi:unnamed protein product [Acanthoscelides obtectus]|uniref:Endothelin-converting enzyme 1 n=1 Tax=Acanthoscelides obtectus TaxID=200917 RepID=A0A9P0JP23_ACAOB|nr:unnamed protein product [Acanthoscelides obtectus]CAK1642873.1 Neprilysin-4 [Acanthoscelides obtectus]